MRRDQDMDNWNYEEEKVFSKFGSDEEAGNQIPTQAQTIVEGSAAVLMSEFKPVPDVDYLQVCNFVFRNGSAVGHLCSLFSF